MNRERSRKQEGRRPPAAGHRSGSPAVLVNTSFNVWGEPIVCTPDDAYRCFMNTEMDNLVMGNFSIEHLVQPHAKVERRLAARIFSNSKCGASSNHTGNLPGSRMARLIACFKRHEPP